MKDLLVVVVEVVVIVVVAIIFCIADLDDFPIDFFGDGDDVTLFARSFCNKVDCCEGGVKAFAGEFCNKEIFCVDDEEITTTFCVEL